MDYIKLLRPHQWVKNLFIFFPAFAAGINIVNFPPNIYLAFLAFCLGSSAVYVTNDIFDAERDRTHNLKKNRPIASGSVSQTEGWAIAGTLAVLSSTLAYYASNSTLGFIIAYVTLNLIYSLKTKHVPILDTASIALGFCLRLLAGGVGFAIAVSPLLLIPCYFGAMGMALIKRRIELSLLLAQNAQTPQSPKKISRPSLKGLNLPTLDLLIGIFASTAVVVYAQWTVSIGKPLAIFTLPPLSIVLARVIWLAYLNKKGEDFARTLLSDAYALISTMLFLAILAASIYA